MLLYNNIGTYKPCNFPILRIGGRCIPHGVTMRRTAGRGPTFKRPTAVVSDGVATQNAAARDKKVRPEDGSWPRSTRSKSPTGTSSTCGVAAQGATKSLDKVKGEQVSNRLVMRGEGKIASQCYSRENGDRSTGRCLLAWCYAPRKPAFSVAPFQCAVQHKFVLLTSTALRKLHVIIRLGTD